MKQQETFMQQLFDLHRLNRVQNMAWFEVMTHHEHHHLTQVYGQEALAALNSSKPQGSVGRGSSAFTGAAQQQQLQTQQVQLDDGGAAAVAALPVHMALLANIPSAMKAAVSQPGSGSIAALNVHRYHVRQGPAIIRPVARRSTARSAGKGHGSSSPLLAPAGGGRERSRVRSNRFSSRQESIGSDNSASSIDNPNFMAAAAAAAVAGDGFEVAAGAGGPPYYQTQFDSGVGRGGSSHRGSSSRKQYHHGSSGGGYAARSGGGAVSSSSYQASAVCGHSTAKSAAGILLSLSGCHASDV
eukprot:gene1726-2069_t